MGRWLEKFKKKDPHDQPNQHMEQCFNAMLNEVTAADPGPGYLEYEEPENQAAIGRAERKLGAAWARGLAGDESAVKDFDKALEELRKAFMKSIEDYKK